MSGLWIQLKKEKEVALFMQEVMLGTFNPVAAESREAILKVSENFIRKLIHDRQKNGYFRADLDDDMLVVFLLGATMRFKGAVATLLTLVVIPIVYELFYFRKSKRQRKQQTI